MIRNALLVAAALLVPAASRAQVKLLRHPTYSKGKSPSATSATSGLRTRTARVSAADRPQRRAIFIRASRRTASDRLFLESRGQLRRVRGPGRRREAEPAHLPQRGRHGGRLVPAMAGASSSVRRAEGAFPSVTTLLRNPRRRRHGAADADRLGLVGSYSPDGKKLASNRHPLVWSRKHYRGSYAADLWVMDVAARISRISATRLQGQLSLADVRRNGEIFFVADRAANEKNDQVRRPGSDEERQQYLEGPRTRRRAGPGDAAHERQSLLPVAFPPTARPSSTRRTSASGSSTSRAARPRDKSTSTPTKENEVELRTVNGEADAFHLSPSGTRAR